MTSSVFKPSTFKDKRFLVTGHTGFKGFWLSRMLVNFGAKVYGVGLEPLENSLFYRCPNLGLASNEVLDIRNFEQLNKYINSGSFDGVFHLAAHSLVLDSYVKPRETFETNVMGTVNLLDSVFKAENCP